VAGRCADLGLSPVIRLFCGRSRCGGWEIYRGTSSLLSMPQNAGPVTGASMGNHRSLRKVHGLLAGSRSRLDVLLQVRFQDSFLDGGSCPAATSGGRNASAAYGIPEQQCRQSGHRTCSRPGCSLSFLREDQGGMKWLMRSPFSFPSTG